MGTARSTRPLCPHNPSAAIRAFRPFRPPPITCQHRSDAAGGADDDGIPTPERCCLQHDASAAELHAARQAQQRHDSHASCHLEAWSAEALGSGEIARRDGGAAAHQAECTLQTLQSTRPPAAPPPSWPGAALSCRRCVSAALHCAAQRSARPLQTLAQPTQTLQRERLRAELQRVRTSR